MSVCEIAAILSRYQCVHSIYTPLSITMGPITNQWPYHIGMIHRPMLPFVSPRINICWQTYPHKKWVYNASICGRPWPYSKLSSHHSLACNLLFSSEALLHYGDVIMGTITSQITSLTIVYLTVYSDADHTKHQSSASLAFVRGIHRGPVNSPHKWAVTRKMFPFDDVIMFRAKLVHICHVVSSRPSTYAMMAAQSWSPMIASFPRHNMYTS